MKGPVEVRVPLALQEEVDRGGGEKKLNYLTPTEQLFTIPLVENILQNNGISLL